MSSQSASTDWLERPILRDPSKLFTFENLLIVLILALAIVSRFAILGERVMSHDEINHVVPSYNLYQGQGYRHDPVTHGPFQFHIVALSYFLFGDNDFTSRIPAALFSLGAVAFLIFAFRRYLGRTGALIAGLLFMISPYMLYYGRYTRNEAFIELVGVMTLFGILRFLEKGDRFSMFVVTISTALHFCIKETAFIYTAQALIFLFFMFLVETRRAEIRRPERFNRFLMSMVAAMVLVFVALGLALYKADTGAGVEAPPPSLFDAAHLRLYAELIAVIGAIGLAFFGLRTLAQDIGWKQIRRMRSFILLILIGTLILPMLSPMPVYMLGYNPLEYSETISIIRTGTFVALFFVLAIAIGLWWNPILWLQNAFAFYAIFIVFYTTFFTNGDGFFTGIVGSLGYWLSQQGVQRGNQPRYYYALLQMPVYEYLSLLGTALAAYFGIRYRLFSHFPGFAPAHSPRSRQVEVPVTGSAEPEEIAAPVYSETTEPALDEEEATVIQPGLQPAEEDFYTWQQPLPILGFLLYWAFSSLLAYSLAGERMPWLTVHVAMGFLLAAAWGFGFLIDTTPWRRLTQMKGLLAVLLFPVFYAALTSALGGLLGANPPFQGNTLEQLRATSRFIFAVIATSASLVGIIYLLRGWLTAHILRLGAVVFFALMAVLTARTAYLASFINYDYATEYLVYAHAAPGPKQVLRQIEDISRRTAGEKSIQVAYSSDGLYPYWWYLRDYPNHRWYQTEPTRDLRDFPVVIAGEDVFGSIEPVLGDNYFRFDYIRLWWPNQDYFGLFDNYGERIRSALGNPEMRAAVFDIWLNRDYTDYARLTNQTTVLSPETWSPAARMRVYIRRDVVAQIWEYGAGPAVLGPEVGDPYAENMIELSPVQVVGGTGEDPGRFQAPRGIQAAPDGSLYVADSRNHRIQHIAEDGSVIHTWGGFAESSSGPAAEGMFNEPWDVAIGPDGSVYVSDTWNHRIQKFTADGQFLLQWGYFGQGETPEGFYGPRGVATDQQGRVYVMDTGNKRVSIFDADGNAITQFGTSGFGPGQFNEPVGIALDAEGNIYITDTWNQRVQVMQPSADGLFFSQLLTWEIDGWDGQSVDNKPFLAVSPVTGNVLVTDPEEPRVLEFDREGNFIRGWGRYSTTPDGFGLVSGITVAPDGSVWVSDSGNNYLLRFQVQP
jgi:predicted membrane-bound mannosyltransferase/DNA-binding beta-propeller fold protein YncE